MLTTTYFITTHHIINLTIKIIIIIISLDRQLLSWAKEYSSFCYSAHFEYREYAQVQANANQHQTVRQYHQFS